MKQCIVTIPQEIVDASKIDFSKPVYLYSDFKVFYLSNRKGIHNCFGEIKFDSEYTFTISQNAFRLAIGAIYLEMYVLNGKIYITPSSFPEYNLRKEICDRTFTIPSEILSICKLSTDKPVYLYLSKRDVAYLSNAKKLDKCLGIIPLDNNSFYLSDNICKSLKIQTSDDISVYVSNGLIFFKKYKYSY